MNIHCKNDWLYHLWGTDGKCIRGCGATGPRTLDPDLLAHVQTDVTVVPDRSLSASPVRVHLVGPASRHGSRLLPR